MRENWFVLATVLLVVGVALGALAAPPQIAGVEKTGDKTVLISFDESVQAYSTVELEDWTVGGTNPIAHDWKSSSQLELTFAAAVTLAVNLDYDRLAGVDDSIKEATGLPLYDATVAVTDTTPPSIVSVRTIDTKKVEVKFDEATDQGKDNAPWSIFEDPANVPAAVGNLTWGDDYTLQIEFPNAVKAGDTLFYDQSKAATDVKDKSGNVLPDKYVTIADGLAPTITKVEQTGEKTVLVTFSEYVTHNFEAVDWVIVGNPALSGVFTDDAINKVTTLEITFTNAIATNINYYEYRGTPDSITDLAGNPLADSGVIAVVDTISPTIVSAKKTDDKKVTVKFSENVPGAYEAGDWWIGEDPANAPAAPTIAGDTWTFTFANDVTVGNHLYYDQDATTADSVKDPAGNPLEDTSVEITDGIPPMITKVEQTGEKTVLVTFSEYVTHNFEAVDWVIVGNPALSGVFTDDAINKVTTLEITFTNAIATNINYYEYRGTPDSITDLAGNPLADSGVIAVVDTISPTIVSAKKTDDKKVTVKFSENVPGAYEAGDWWIGEDPANAPAAPTIAGDTWTFTFANDVTVGNHLYYDQDATTADSVKDPAGNPLEDTSVEITDGIPPTFTNVDITGNKAARVKFDDVVTNNFEPGDWWIAETGTHPIGGVFSVVTPAAPAAPYSVLDLTFNVSLVAGRNLHYEQAGGTVPDSIRDANGNAMLDKDVAMAAGGGAQLDVVSVVKSRDCEVIVTFTKPVAPSSVLELGDWTLVNIPTQPAAIDGAFIADDLLWLRFPVNVAVGDTLKYDATNGVANSIQDAAANKLPTGIWAIAENTAIVTVNDLTLPAGSTGVVTISVDMAGAGLGGMQVGPTGRFTFDPTAINVTEIAVDPPYAVLASNIDNVAGQATFALTLTGDAAAAVRTGVVVMIDVTSLPTAGGTSSLGLTVDFVKDANDGGVNPTIQNGTLTIGAGGGAAGDGDVNGDGLVDITDARWAAEYAIGIRTLTAAQIAAADVAPPAGVDITDARWIAEAAIGLRTLSVMTMRVAPMTLPSTAQVAINEAGQLVISGSTAELADIQGTLYFDPTVMNVTDVVGLNGFQVLATSIDSATGEVQFAAAKLSGSMVVGAPILQFKGSGDLTKAALHIDVLRDVRGRDVAVELAIPASGLNFSNYPNPITDVHTTTFKVKGLMATLVDAIKVQIFDLSGRLVYDSGEISGISFDWHTDNDYGEYLANGVYLYKMYALIDDQWTVSKTKTLVILR